MEKHRFLSEVAENLALLTQLGLSVAIPPLLCLAAAGWLRSRFDLGLWIMVVGLLLGIGGGMTSFWKLWKMIEKRQAKRRNK